ncbi:MAG: RNA 2',3'-cyclic phosphodiesterase [Candidatus Binataceae bacterium]
MLRLFVAFSLPDGVIARLSMLCSGVPGARWVEPENMHVTLRFIGEVDETTAAEIDHALSAIEAPAFSTSLAGINTFGKDHKAHTLWVGVQPSPALTHLQAKVESAIVRSGQPSEQRKFTPHVTLARMTKPEMTRLQNYIEGNALFSAGPFSVDQFTLYESQPGNGGPVYTPLADYSLQG